ISAYFLGGFGITALYHRAWTHNAVKFSKWLEYVLAVGSTLVLQQSAKNWIRHHVLHHLHTDSDLDPYNINRGFWWAHFEWILFQRTIEGELPTRLRDHKVVEWQHKWYWPLFLTVNFAIPTGIALATGLPWYSGILLSALRLVITSHMIYCINSACHKWGTRRFSKTTSARDAWWFPFALGEQYHNFHHVFPRDYRHGVRAYDFDPTKWLIWVCCKLGCAREPFATPESRIRVAVEAAPTAPPPRRELTVVREDI
ncbi:MAG: acyl-CoA desaturase, partial [Hyphomicrobiaceae bacterium]